MLDISLFGAFLGGILSFISPCVLPLVPPYLCYVAGITYDELSVPTPAVQRRVILSSLCFVAGFGTVFVGLGAIASTFGQFMTENAELFTYIAGGLIILFGLHFLGLFRIPLLYREARMNLDVKGGLFGAFLLGLAFAFGWTPCVGPILAAILFMAGGEDTVLKGILLLSSYAAGIGLPFILAAAFASRFLAVSKTLKRRMPVIEKVSGVFLILTGILFITGGINAIGYWIQELVPGLGQVG